MNVIVIEHAGWPERRKGTLTPGLHRVPQPGDPDISVVSLDNGEIVAVQSDSVFTPEGLAYAEEWATKTHSSVRSIRIPDALAVA